ncbi:mRNA-capping enzyme [Coccinella septempunctata]|uniref:mRNA-capping enzyme n=1 Tax=Coccinella septempunctata TaxID=41139 RepID=UPI001D061750|nr:mRNA-capping enzyme [Coccinella septempunctata]
MSKFGSSPGPVPDRWLHCPRKADQLILNKIMAFKTPLSSRFDEVVPPECRFPPSMLFDICRRKKIKLGLWIDLTNTSRFYDKEDIESQGCKYLKLSCRGHGECPSEQQTTVFVNCIHEFLSRNPLDVIGVHCTHGFNRTGFLIVSYLIQKCDCSLELALAMFAKARPPGIYKPDYIQELYRRYDDIEDCIEAPERPDWESDYSESNEMAASTSSSGSNNKDDPQFMDGVPGVTLFRETPKMFNLQKKVQRMCEWRKKGFPGCQPVTMDNENLHLLKQKPYMVSWKADGMRYLMLIDGPDEIYFFDRDNNVFKVSNLVFLYRKDLNVHLRDTLLDGEMVIDKVKGESIPRYLVYDIVRFMNQEVGKTHFSSVRLLCIEKEIISPRNSAKEKGIINRDEEPFSVRKKEFWGIEWAKNLLGPKFAASLSHEPDGLIFQPSEDPYCAGRCDSVLKWKPTELNSVDFKMRIVKEQREGCIPRKVIQLFVGQLSEPFSYMKFNKELKDLDGKIIECKYERNQWVFMRERTDKSFPNSFDTAMSVCKSIQKPLTKEALLAYIEDIVDEKMMPPPKKIKR